MPGLTKLWESVKRSFAQLEKAVMLKDAQEEIGLSVHKVVTESLTQRGSRKEIIQ